MPIYKRTPQGAAFKMLVGMYPHGTDPSRAGGVPLKLRDTFTVGPVMRENAGNINSRNVLDVTGYFSARGVITLADNDFSTGAAEVILGDYHLLAGLDFAISAVLNTTAANLATAINRLPEFGAGAVGPDIFMAYYGGTNDQVTFKAYHYGTITNFTFNPPEPYDRFAQGSPGLGAPLLT